jgi:hypothetical protein
MTQPLDAGSLLIHTAGLVGGNRARVHGDKVQNHQKIADCFSAVLSAAGKLSRDVRLDAHDAANMIAEVAVPSALFAEILQLIADLRPPPNPAPA